MFKRTRRLIAGTATWIDKVVLIVKGLVTVFSSIWIVGVLVAVIAVIVATSTNSSNSPGGGMDGGGLPIPAEVLKWEPYFLAEAKKFEIEGHVLRLMAIATVESGGRLPDIMQSSESKGLPMNTIDNEPESIEQGVKHYANTLQLASEAEVDEWAALQAYNFGTSYIGYVSQRGKVHTLDLAESYSRDVVAPSLGNTSGSTYGYVNAVSQANGRPYLYWNGGNFHYVDLVRQYLGSPGIYGDYILPLEPPNISSWFGWRTHPNSGGANYHRGIDFAHPQGTPIKAIADGTVIASEFHASWGNYVRIEHANGYCSLYAHNVSNNVRVGDKVRQGDIIGHVGTTGDSSGPHLHLEISTTTSLSQDVLLDPAEVLGLK